MARMKIGCGLYAQKLTILDTGKGSFLDDAEYSMASARLCARQWQLGRGYTRCLAVMPTASSATNYYDAWELGSRAWNCLTLSVRGGSGGRHRPGGELLPIGPLNIFGGRLTTSPGSA